MLDPIEILSKAHNEVFADLTDQNYFESQAAMSKLFHATSYLSKQLALVGAYDRVFRFLEMIQKS